MKYYTDSKGRKYPVNWKKIQNLRLYFLADCFENLKEDIIPLVSHQTQRLLLELSDALYNEIPHLDCDNLTECYIVEEGYRK